MKHLPLRKTRAEVDLDAIQYNIERLQERSRVEDYLILLKADAYGHGAIALGHLADEIGLRFGGVASLQEAVRLRRAGVRLPILILEDLFPDEIPFALAKGFRLTVSSRSYAEAVCKAACSRGQIGKIHLNLDTGMGRLGCFPSELVDLARFVDAEEMLELEGVYSHLPSSDDGELETSRGEMELFRSCLDSLEREGISPRWRHIANSGAVIDFPKLSGFNLIRPGLASFGLYPSTEVDHSLKLRQAMRITSALLMIKRYPSGSTIGYGSTFVTRRESLIGVVPLGYGDGYFRLFSNRSQALVHGTRVPVVGRISMDMLTLDLTDIPEEVQAGDEVVMSGSQSWGERSEWIGIDELASLARTIPYEITCALASRVPRLYMRQGQLVAEEDMNGAGYRPRSAMD